jgi:hypothetical protein
VPVSVWLRYDSSTTTSVSLRRLPMLPPPDCARQARRHVACPDPVHAVTGAPAWWLPFVRVLFLCLSVSLQLLRHQPGWLTLRLQCCGHRQGWSISRCRVMLSHGSRGPARSETTVLHGTTESEPGSPLCRSSSAHVTQRAQRCNCSCQPYTRPCVGRVRASRRVPLAGTRCVVSLGPRLRLSRPVSRPVCGLGVCFGFASRCVALLCGVFVRLHLALFPAGGPVLPSL